ncbi:hypothetical protein [Pedobacter metabolipauper]|uniref:VWFA domain-containing protein n=1 Tax=Pedobacter metabolipauper TaxID=425513 RepID=A0A4R6SVS8_9SPHI|nr:hypothetical protein [Pedobacter metabolipauper]TDQ09466.1 hypothetical protein ATK78_1620 [Pedobacter metabolipauper]
MKTKLSVLISSVALLLVTGCMDEKENIKEAIKIRNNSKNADLNISILIDLSDRIDPIKNANPAMEIYRRDLGYIESISKGFEKHLRSKPIIQDDDHIQIYFEPAPLNPKINDLAKNLKLSFTKDNTTKKAIQKISPQYIAASNKIYNLAIKDKKYIGSDIWGFFKNKVKDYCIKPNHRNILFILTDGYMFHKNSKFMIGNKSSYLTPELVKSLKLNTPKYRDLIRKKGYGFINANDNLDNLEVVILSLNPAEGNPFEADVIGEYWNNWLKEMKVKSPIMKPFSADLPANLDPIIQKYISPG